jgi:hypothetical protein
VSRLSPAPRAAEPVWDSSTLRLRCPSFKLGPRSLCKLRPQPPASVSASPVPRSITRSSARAAASQRHPPSLDDCEHTRPQPGPGTPIRSLTRSRPALAPAPALRAPARRLPPSPASPAHFPPCHRAIERPSSPSRPTRWTPPGGVLFGPVSKGGRHPSMRSLTAGGASPLRLVSLARP